VITTSEIQDCLNCGKENEYVMGSCRNCGTERPAIYKHPNG
jgi:predicted ATP-dependent serine protease